MGQQGAFCGCFGGLCEPCQGPYGPEALGVSAGCSAWTRIRMVPCAWLCVLCLAQLRVWVSLVHVGDGKVFLPFHPWSGSQTGHPPSTQVRWTKCPTILKKIVGMQIAHALSEFWTENCNLQNSIKRCTHGWTQTSSIFQAIPMP